MVSDDWRTYENELVKNPTNHRIQLMPLTLNQTKKGTKVSSQVLLVLCAGASWSLAHFHLEGSFLPRISRPGLFFRAFPEARMQKRRFPSHILGRALRPRLFHIGPFTLSWPLPILFSCCGTLCRAIFSVPICFHTPSRQDGTIFCQHFRFQLDLHGSDLPQKQRPHRQLFGPVQHRADDPHSRQGLLGTFRFCESVSYMYFH